MSLTLMKVLDQKEEESPTLAINNTVIQNSSLTEVENVMVLIESEMYNFYLNIKESPQSRFLVTVC